MMVSLALSSNEPGKDLYPFSAGRFCCRAESPKRVRSMFQVINVPPKAVRVGICAHFVAAAYVRERTVGRGSDVARRAFVQVLKVTAVDFFYFLNMSGIICYVYLVVITVCN